MIEPYSEPSTPNALPQWATLTQVSEATGVSRSAVRSVARRALKHEEPWVKKEDGKILLDTHHDTYKSHARRWEDESWYTAFPDDIEITEDYKESATSNKQESFYNFYHWYPSLATEGYNHWPQFCQWLASQGLCVFLNLLTGEETLHWTWGELHGEINNASVRDAIIAALDCKFNHSSSPEGSSFLPSMFTPPSSTEGSQHFWPFKRSKITKVIR